MHKFIACLLAGLLDAAPARMAAEMRSELQWEPLKPVVATLVPRMQQAMQALLQEAGVR